MDMASPFQLCQGVGHRPACNMKRAGKLGRRAFITDTRQMVQNRKMRKLHPARQNLGNPGAGQLIGSEQLSEQGNRDVFGPFLHQGPSIWRS